MSRVHVAIVTALGLEADAVCRELEDQQVVQSRLRRYFTGTVNGKAVVVWPIDAVGNVASALATRAAIAIFNPDFVILAGIAGGVRAPERRLGDVLVPEQVVYHELGKVRDTGLEARWEVFRASRDFLAVARAVSEHNWWQTLDVTRPDNCTDPPEVHFGVLASGEKVVASQDAMGAITDAWSQSLGIEMEGIGVAAASYESEEAPGFGIVKAISDWADSSKNDDWQIYAASASARLTVEIVAALPATRSGRLQPQVAGSSLSIHVSNQIRAGWGEKKLELCRRLSIAEAADLADWLEIPLYDQDRFDSRWCQGVWNWLELRNRLSEFPAALAAIGRADLAELIDEATVLRSMQRTSSAPVDLRDSDDQGQFRSDQAARTLDELRRRVGSAEPGITPEQLADRIGVSRQRAGKLLADLLREGLIEQLGIGYYLVTR